MDRDLLLLLSEYLGVIAVTMLASISPRLKRRPLIFKYPKREGIIASSLFLMILIMNVILHSEGFQIGNTLGLSDQNTILWERLIISFICLAPFVLALLIRKQPLLSTGWNKSIWGSAVRLGISLVFLALFLRGKIFLIINGISAEEGQALLLWLGIAFAEENIFRGYMQPRLSAWSGGRFGWIIAGLFFTLWHLPRLLILPGDLIYNIGYVLIQGMVLGWVFRKGGHALPNILYRTVSEWLWFVV